MMRFLKNALATLGGLALGSRPEDATARGVETEETGDAHRSRWRRRLRTIAAFLGVVAAVGLLVAASGIVPIKASSGHWAITRWFLEFSMARSVSFHSMGIEAPSRDSLRSPSLVLKGAGHYETGCAPCHGSPGAAQPLVPRRMTPQTPYLPEAAGKWEPAELFYIVKHGIKFAGMPAWPSEGRDDEVWAVAAFLLRLPELDAEAYRSLAYGPQATDADPATLRRLALPQDLPLAVSTSCARCHGSDGRGRGTGAFPRLAGQRLEYLYATLAAYANGERHSGVMQPVAVGLSDRELRALARYYAELPAADSTAPGGAGAPSASRDSVDAAAIARGEAIALRGVPTDRIPSCADCHGPGGTPRNPAYPLLAGQYADYLRLQLELFNTQQRGGTPYVRVMHPTAHRLSPAQMRDVSLFYASLTIPDGLAGD